MWGLRTIWYIVGGRDEGLPEWGKLTRAEGAPRTRAELKPERGNALGTNLNPRELSPVQSPGSLLWRKLREDIKVGGEGVLHQINRVYLQ